jgi:N,N'-diacetyllegionaminate synthase
MAMDRVMVIAEIGVNHNGELAIALRLTEEARKAGADAVKFQTFRAEALATSYAKKADYQKDGAGAHESQYEMLRRLELSAESHLLLVERCRCLGLTFISSAFDLESVAFLATLDLPYWKIPSGEITNVPYLRRIGSMNKRIILSTGMSYLGEVEKAIETLAAAGTARCNLTVMQCNSEYPTPYEDAGVRTMVTMREAFKVPVGYSDHSLGIEIPIAAVALGASIIEKHFTLGRTMDGPDHRSSLEPAELKAMVDAIRNVERGMGDGIKTVSASERKNREIVRKSIVAARAISRGEIFDDLNITAKRPGTGISASEWDRVIGRTATRSYSKDDLIEW